MIKIADDRYVKLRIGAYVIVLGWYLIAFAALIGWAQWEIGPPVPGCTDCGVYGFVVLVRDVVPGTVVVVTGAATGCALAGRWMARAEPATLLRSLGLGTAAAGMGFLIGLAGLAALCALAVGVAFALHLLHLLG